MALFRPRPSRLAGGPVRLACLVLALPAALYATAAEREARIDVLRVGTSGNLAATTNERQEKSALESLKKFIKDETRLNNEILRQKDWRELADKMAKGDLHVGVFLGFEFAWAQEKQPDLQPLVLAVNVHRYPVVHVVTQRGNAAKDFAGLQGQSVALPPTGGRTVRLYVERQCLAAGKKLDEFFSKVTEPENVEDALDDVVDGAVKAAVADRAALEAYKRRKPGRFNQLKQVVQSQPFPPAVIAYHRSVLDEGTRQLFRMGLLRANRSERGETTLTLFRLTGFETPPADLDKVLAETRKAYPVEPAK